MPLAVAVLAGLLASCASTVAPTEASNSVTPLPPTFSPTDSQSPPIATPAGSPPLCSTTVGRPGTKPPAPFNPDDLPVGYVDTWYGNDAIWIRLPKEGIIPALPDDGQVTISAKFPWWRVLPGQLQEPHLPLRVPALLCKCRMPTTSRIWPVRSTTSAGPGG